DDEHAEALVAARGGIGAREDEAIVRDTRVAAPDLVAADQVLVATTRGFRLEREQIRAGLGLAEPLPERGVTAPDARQHVAAQTLRAVLNDALRRLIAARERAKGRADGGQLLEEHQRVHQRPLLAAEALRPGQRHPSLIRKRQQERPRVRARSVARVHAIHWECLGRMRAQEPAYLFGERPLGRAELEVHERFALRSAAHSRAGVSGMSRCVTPRCASASTAALTTAGGMPMQPASPTPLAPSGLRGEGVQVFSIMTCGTSSARGIA